MGDKSTIEWTDATWNPTVGCSIVSPGCTNCYAMHVAAGLERRFGSEKYRGLTKSVNGNIVWTGEVRLDDDALLQPLKWKRGRKIFVNSMSDLFHESLSDEQIDKVFAVMALCPQHIFQVLTKRAERMRDYITTANRCHIIGDQMMRLAKIGAGFKCVSWPFLNVWLGVSAERQQEADERIPHLLATPAAVRFVSAEPLLGPLDLSRMPFINGDPRHKRDALTGFSYLFGRGVDGHPDATIEVKKPLMSRLDWIIVGGESGKHARPMHPDWARSLRDQCAAADVPFFFKQWGEHAPMVLIEDGIDPATPWRESPGGNVSWMIDELRVPADERPRVAFWKVGKKAAGRLLDGKEHNEFPSRQSQDKGLV